MNKRTRLREIEKRLAKLEMQMNQQQAYNPKNLNIDFLKKLIMRFQSPDGATRDNAPESS